MVAAAVGVGCIQDDKRGEKFVEQRRTFSSPSLCASNSWHLVFVFHLRSHWVKKEKKKKYAKTNSETLTHTYIYTHAEWETGEKENVRQL